MTNSEGDMTMVERIFIGMAPGYYSRDGGFSPLETVLPDDYMLPGQKTFLFDGAFHHISIAATDYISVGDYKARYGVKEIRRFHQEHHVKERHRDTVDSDSVADDVLSARENDDDWGVPQDDF